MSILGPYVHNIDPVIGTILGIHLWWYGLSYTMGFLIAFLFIKHKRRQMGLSLPSVYGMSLLMSVGVLLGGRFVEVIFYEWPFYSHHFQLIPAYWLGGMATHGLLLGGLVGIWIFSTIHRLPLLDLTDALAVPAAFIMGIGRIGNFIDGQIVGSVTSVWWAVKFPDAEGFRHPVVLYDGLKNLLIIPILAFAAKRKLHRGVLTGIFLFLYAFLRVFVDVFREYPTAILGLATGQALNILMAALGLGLMIIPFWRSHGPAESLVPGAADVQETQGSSGLLWRKVLLAAILLSPLVIPSDWTQDIPARYGHRHAGLVYSALYPRIDITP